MVREIVYRHDIPRDLSPSQVDGNFQALDTDLATAEAAIAGIQLAGPAGNRAVIAYSPILNAGQTLQFSQTLATVRSLGVSVTTEHCNEDGLIVTMATRSDMTDMQYQAHFTPNLPTDLSPGWVIRAAAIPSVMYTTIQNTSAAIQHPTVTITLEPF